MTAHRTTFPGPHEGDEPSRQNRLDGQYRAIFALMQDGVPRTLEEISYAVEHKYGVRCPPASASAQLRHMRKREYGGHTVTKQHCGHGLYRYRLKVAKKQSALFE